MGWLKAKDQTILALHKRVITHNARIDVDHEEDRSVGRSESSMMRDGSWLQDGYSQIFRLFVFDPSGLKDYGSATLRCKM